MLCEGTDKQFPSLKWNDNITWVHDRLILTQIAAKQPKQQDSTRATTEFLMTWECSLFSLQAQHYINIIRILEILQAGCSSTVHRHIHVQGKTIAENIPSDHQMENRMRGCEKARCDRRSFTVPRHITTHFTGTCIRDGFFAFNYLSSVAFQNNIGFIFVCLASTLPSELVYGSDRGDILIVSQIVTFYSFLPLTFD